MDRKIYSPDRRYYVELHTVEMRMSHWVSAPCVRDATTGQPILDLSHTIWHADRVRWHGAGRRVTLRLRRYPGRQPAIILVVDLADHRCVIRTPSQTRRMDVRRAVEWLLDWGA